MSNGIEGYPVIIRFKTFKSIHKSVTAAGSIEGYPVIIRFKTEVVHDALWVSSEVLKVIQL